MRAVPVRYRHRREISRSRRRSYSCTRTPTSKPAFLAAQEGRNRGQRRVRANEPKRLHLHLSGTRKCCATCEFCIAQVPRRRGCRQNAGTKAKPQSNPLQPYDWRSEIEKRRAIPKSPRGRIIGFKTPSWRAEIVDSEECGQTSQNGYIFTCPEPGNAVQHVNFTLPNFLGEGGAGKMPAPNRSLS